MLWAVAMIAVSLAACTAGIALGAFVAVAAFVRRRPLATVLSLVVFALAAWSLQFGFQFEPAVGMAILLSAVTFVFDTDAWLRNPSKSRFVSPVKLALKAVFVMFGSLLLAGLVMSLTGNAFASSMSFLVFNFLGFIRLTNSRSQSSPFPRPRW